MRFVAAAWPRELFVCHTVKANGRLQQKRHTQKATEKTCAYTWCDVTVNARHGNGRIPQLTLDSHRRSAPQVAAQLPLTKVVAMQQNVRPQSPPPPDWSLHPRRRRRPG